MPSEVLDFWHILVVFLKENDCLPKFFFLSHVAGHVQQEALEEDLRVTSSDFYEIIKEQKISAFVVQLGPSRIDGFFSLHQNHFTRHIGEKHKSPKEWTPLIKKIISRFEAIGGWEPHALYKGWQNLRGPEDYKSGKWGALPTGYQTISVQHKYSVGPAQILFTNHINPGRTKIVDHRCIFYPTAEMWLGPHFWQYAKCTKEEALAAGFWLETGDTPHFTYFKCWPRPFTRPDGEQGRMQQRLWKLFFHEECEWPPGSGTICDEASYGPPELMPTPQSNPPAS